MPREKHLPTGGAPLRLSLGLRTAAARRPDRPALISGATIYRYGDIVRRMNRLANAASVFWGLRAGDIVALIAPNRPEYVEIVEGLSDLGVIVATLNPRLSTEELKGILADCAPRLAFIDPSLEALAEATRQFGVKTVLIGADYEDALSRASDALVLPPIEDKSSFSLCYTSGTTGAPKGVLLSHRSRALTFLAMALEYECFGGEDRFLALTPLCHGAGFAFAGAAMSFGGACELFNSADPERIADRLKEGDITGVFMVPTHFSRLFSSGDNVVSDLRTRCRLSAVISNAAALGQPLKERAVEAFGDGLLHETYGSTEAGIVTNIRPADILKRPGSVGPAFIHTDIEIRGEDGSRTAPGVIGELFSRAPYTFNGYLNQPEETALAVRDGWVSVQDLAKADEDGFITICGRKKDMIVSGGINIYPVEIENVIGRQPGVSEVAVVGLPDEEWGERLHAFVVPTHGKPPLAADIVSACRRELSDYKAPRGVTLVDELPRNASGKLLKRELREKAAAIVGAARRRVS